MSEAPCKEFSAALNTAVTELMLKERPGPAIPAVVMEMQKKLMKTGSWPNGVTCSYGLMDSSSQLMRRISDDKYEFHFKLVFPFKLTPIRDEVRPGFVMLQANADVQHPAVVNGFLDRKALAWWLLLIFKRRCSLLVPGDFGRTFTVMEFFDGKEIQIVCLPVLEFEHSQWALPSPELSTSDIRLRAHPWYAVPQVTRPLDSRSFVVWAPDWERCIMDTHHHSHRLLRLMAAMGPSCDEVEFSNFEQVIRTVLLQELPNLPRDLGNAMIAFLTAVVARLQEGRLSRFLVDNINVLHFNDNEILEKYHGYLSEELQELQTIKLSAQNAVQEEHHVDPINPDTDENARNNHFEGGGTSSSSDEADDIINENVEESWETKLFKMFDILIDQEHIRNI